MKQRETFQESFPQTPHETAIYWLVRLSAQNCTDEERHKFEIWLAQNPQYPEIYAQAQAQWQAMEAFKAIRFPERDAALRYRAPKKYTPRYFALATAATILLALGLTAFDPNGWLGGWETYATEKGEHDSITLTDGSRIELNTDTQVKVHFNRWQRSVELVRGEAFFTVAHNAKRPFKVQAGTGIIQDIGTQFEVFLQPNQVLVAVQEGEVSIQTSQNRNLVAGQQIAYANNGDFISLTGEKRREIPALTAWRQGQLRFNNRRLDDVLAEVARYHDITIHVPDARLAKLPVTGIFKTDNLQGIMNAIALSLPVEGRYENAKTIVLEPR